MDYSALSRYVSEFGEQLQTRLRKQAEDSIKAADKVKQIVEVVEDAITRLSSESTAGGTADESISMYDFVLRAMEGKDWIASPAVRQWLLEDRGALSKLFNFYKSGGSWSEPTDTP